ncbi:MAG: DUF190 domain-containing protein [Anaerolineae bacterium]|nr:DUF190 domain-containing protein [Anaerolineae bacterium]
MFDAEEAYLLRLFIDEDDRCAGKPLYEWIVLRAREQGLAGATVLRGMMGYGANSVIHTFKIEQLSSGLPIVIEIVDAREKLEAFLAEIDDKIPSGLATLERVAIRLYRSARGKDKPSR